MTLILTVPFPSQDPTWRSRLKKDPGVPNLFPFKEKFLQQVEEKNRQKAEELERRKADARAARAGIAGEEFEDEDDDELLDEDTEDEDGDVEMAGDAVSAASSLPFFGS